MVRMSALEGRAGVLDVPFNVRLMTQSGHGTSVTAHARLEWERPLWPFLTGTDVTPLLKEIRHNPLLWLLVLVPVVLAAQVVKPEAHTLLFVLSVAAIVPLAALLSRATESVAATHGAMIGGLDRKRDA